MQIVKFDDIRNEIIRNMKRQMLVPIVGSGFTQGCRSQSGIVPSGDEFKQHMVNAIVMERGLSEAEKSDLLNDKFSEVSAIYQTSVSEKSQKDYLKKHFTSVRIDNECKCKFLKIRWPYIYTLNIDDAIEKNSDFSQVVYSNRQVNPAVFTDYQCVIKLHGDITEVLTYYDAMSEVFSQEQYLKSLKLNIPLLNKLNHDSAFLNLFFVGCSLTDEIDILVYAQNKLPTENKSSHYFCMTSRPGNLQRIKLERYGITHVVLFDSFDVMYQSIYDAWLESTLISKDELELYKSFHIHELNCDYDINKPYLLHGKGLVKKDRTLTIPYYFISRDIVDDIISNIENKPFQLVIGSGSSGKTYIMIDIARKIKAKDVFLFESKDRISAAAFNSLITKKNCVLLIDNSAFTLDQVEIIIKEQETFKRNDVQTVLFSSKNNRDLVSLINLLEYKAIIPKNSLEPIQINNKFSKAELGAINPLLIAIGAGIFSFDNSTIIDNLINMCSKLQDSTKYSAISPSFEDKRNIAVLIILAIKKKIYSRQAIDFDILQALHNQVKRVSPLIEKETTWSFEKDAYDNSPEKWVLNADYWLFNQLGEYSNSISNRRNIIEAYKYIVSKTIEIEGKLDLVVKKDYSYKDYILFDNINEIFYRHGKGGIILIREIYENLNELLSLDPHYMHQRAKCYIRSAFIENNDKLQSEYIDRAYRDANVAEQVFQKRYNESKNEKILISLAHVTFSQAIIVSFECKKLNYSNVSKNDAALEKVSHALLSPYNEEEYLREDGRNHNNPINELIYTCFSDKTLISDQSFSNLAFIANKIRQLQQQLNIF
jgi:hypothetical protein